MFVLTAYSVDFEQDPPRARPGRPLYCSVSRPVFATTDELTLERRLGAELRSIPRPSLLATPLEAKGKTEKGLATLGIETVGDLIEHLPHAHHDRGDARAVATVGVGEDATIAVAVRSVAVKPMRDRRRKRVEAKVFDETGPMVAIWWNRPWVATEFGEGSQLLLHGKMKKRNDFHVNDHEVMGAGDGAVGHSLGLVPVHPATYGLSAATLRRMLWSHYRAMRHAVEPLPSSLRVTERLADRSAALAGVHFPDTERDEAEARRRLAFEELFLAQVAVVGRRRTRSDARRAAPLESTGELVDPWLEGLPFQPTGDQRSAAKRMDSTSLATGRCSDC